VQERREAHALFQNIRRRTAQVDPTAFAHLGGFTLYLWFNGDSRIELPFKPSDTGAIDELMQDLANYRPDAGRLRIPLGRVPEGAPDLGLVTTSSGAAFYAVPHLNAVPDTAFWAAMGFELGFAYTTEHTPSRVWDEIQRLVDQHDKAALTG
jgi:hypothetical protein